MAIPNNKLKDVAFSSLHRYEIVALRGSVTYSSTGIQTVGTYNATINHNLGYKPFYKAWIQFPGSSSIYQLETGSGSFGIVGSYQVEDSKITTTQLLVSISNYAAGGGTGQIYYRIYKEPQSA
jgi:hypothetical protein